MSSQWFLYNWLIPIDLGLEHKHMRNHRNREKTTPDKYPSFFFFLIWFPPSPIYPFILSKLFLLLFWNYPFFMATLIVEPDISDSFQTNFKILH